MKTLYYENNLDAIISSIKDYVNQSDDTIEQKKTYLAELELYKDDFTNLVQSGVFHDACGKTINVFEKQGQIIAEVDTEY